jgi:hypothetical protein
MSESLILPLAEALWSPGPAPGFRDDQVGRRAPDETASNRRRGVRLHMHGTGYRGAIDDRPVALIDLSVSGVQARGPFRLRPGQSIIFKIGWPQDELSCAALGRVQWVRVEPARRETEASYGIGLAFETWDVRLLKEIMHHCQRMLVP